jgi:hypothetical protein
LVDAVELTLALLVARIFANDAHNALPADNPAGFTQFLDGGSDFHSKKEGAIKWSDLTMPTVGIIALT